MSFSFLETLSHHGVGDFSRGAYSTSIDFLFEKQDCNTCLCKSYSRGDTSIPWISVHTGKWSSSLGTLHSDFMAFGSATAVFESFEVQLRNRSEQNALVVGRLAEGSAAGPPKLALTKRYPLVNGFSLENR